MSKDKLQQNIRKSTSNCKVCWPHSLSLWTPSWRKHRSLECWEQFCAAWEMGRMSNMETPSLQDNALLQSFSRNLGTVYGIFFMNLCSWEMKTLLLLLLQSHFLSPRWHVSLAQIRMLARALSMQSEISPAPKLPVTAGIVLQSLLTHLALLFGLFSAWLWLHLELQKYHMHALQKKKSTTVLNVSCHEEPDTLPYFQPDHVGLRGSCSLVPWGKPTPRSYLQSFTAEDHPLGSS